MTALPTRQAAKAQAKALRDARRQKGQPITHAAALEQIAHDHGFRDWNAFSAAIGAQSDPEIVPGMRVTGRYLSQPFSATVKTVHPQRPGWAQLVLDLDEPVDVVRFDSFSNLRKRIRGTIGPDGHSKEKTSDGIPHLVLDRDPVRGPTETDTQD